ncbi:MAG TPA: pyruvate kinase [Candidatus Kapabacteria bacterium]|nr:pyruvate kinase [Candidatus Kapabacteria bacterium]
MQERPKTKIVVTLGPATSSEETIAELIDAGMNIARLNFSHSTPEEHLEIANRIRTVSQRLGEHIAIMGDLPGPKMRTGETEDPAGVMISLDSKPILTFDHDGKTTSEVITTSYPYLGEDVSVNDPILLDDGGIILYVDEIISKTEIRARVKSGGILKSHKGINFPRTKLRIPALTDHDKELARFAVEKIGVDALALSFVRRAGDVLQLRHFLETELHKGDVPIIAKIEKPEAVEHIETILDVADKIMVARGDLGVEMPLEQVPPVQKRIIDMANRRGIPVITATQMLESMISHSRPTRAEASDVANAVFDGTDCVMLSAETSVGVYPVEAVRTMREIAMQAEKSGYVRRQELFETPTDINANAVDSVARAAAVLAEEVNAHAIICATLSGKSVRYMAKYRFSKPVIGMSTEEGSLRRMAFYHGVIPLKLEQIKDFDETLNYMVESAQQKDLIPDTGFVVMTAGHPIFQVSSTNIVKVHRLG